jgi:hypothetical protein
MLNEIARNKLDEAAADRHAARACTATKVREGRAALADKRSRRWNGSLFWEHGSVCRAPRNGTHAAVELPTVLPIRNLQLSPPAQQLVGNNGSIESVCK